jgi:hypothetical protein
LVYSRREQTNLKSDLEIPGQVWTKILGNFLSSEGVIISAKSALQRVVSRLRTKVEEHPRSAEARALHVDQQSHAQHASEQEKIAIRKSAEEKRTATRERLMEEQWHYYCNKEGESMGGSWEEYREAVGHAVHLRRNNTGLLSMSIVIAQTKEKYPTSDCTKMPFAGLILMRTGFLGKADKQN